jgi:crotonobetainyl-CoA:carnitine CoA-transferase CaiB-like acyl-CoA transferase
MANEANTKRRALDGVRIIDLTWLQVGPQATRILATFGAQLIRIEWRNPAAVDFLRYMQPFAPDHATPAGGRSQGAAGSLHCGVEQAAGAVGNLGMQWKP